MAEAITHGTLQEQMTQHGLGTGIYGFVDYTENNSSNQEYRINNNNELSLFRIINPLKLTNTRTEGNENDGYVDRTDLSTFSSLSYCLNVISTEVYTRQNVINEANMLTIIKDTLQELCINNNDKMYEVTQNFSVHITEIFYTISNFINDYNILMSTVPENENYVLMPINYLLYYHNFDGVYNINGDTGSSGSIKYFFQGEYKARGYRPGFKIKEPLSGKLIFLGNYF
jgi:hypothetical protein